MTTVVLAVVIFYIDNRREKRSVPLAKSQAPHVLKTLGSTLVENRCLRESLLGYTI